MRLLTSLSVVVVVLLLFLLVLLLLLVVVVLLLVRLFVALLSVDMCEVDKCNLSVWLSNPVGGDVNSRHLSLG